MFVGWGWAYLRDVLVATEAIPHLVYDCSWGSYAEWGRYYCKIDTHKWPPSTIVCENGSRGSTELLSPQYLWMTAVVCEQFSHVGLVDRPAWAIELIIQCNESRTSLIRRSLIRHVNSHRHYIIWKISHLPYSQLMVNRHSHRSGRLAATNSYHRNHFIASVVDARRKPRKLRLCCFMSMLLIMNIIVLGVWCINYFMFP